MLSFCGCSFLGNEEGRPFYGLPFIFPTFEVYLHRREVKKMLLEYLGLLAVFAVVSLLVSVHFMHKSTRHHEEMTWGSE